MYLNDDNPSKAYKTKELTFVSQPLYDFNINIKHNVITVPLIMSDEWKLLHENPTFISECRDQHKSFQFNFVGNLNKGSKIMNAICPWGITPNRKILKNLNLQGYDFEETKSIYNLKTDEKNKRLLSFLQRIAKSRFVFCPRGSGTSSFRLYQSMMVGSVPIVTDSKCFPFEDKTHWDEICICGEMKDLNNLIQIALNLSNVEYFQMRDKAMKFWDQYCRHENLYKYLSTLVK